MENGEDKGGGGVEQIGKSCARCVVLGVAVMAEERIMGIMREP